MYSSRQTLWANEKFKKKIQKHEILVLNDINFS